MRTGAAQCRTSWPPLRPPVTLYTRSGGNGIDGRPNGAHDATRSGDDEGC